MVIDLFLSSSKLNTSACHFLNHIRVVEGAGFRHWVIAKENSCSVKMGERQF